MLTNAKTFYRFLIDCALKINNFEGFTYANYTQSDLKFKRIGDLRSVFKNFEFGRLKSFNYCAANHTNPVFRD